MDLIACIFLVVVAFGFPIAVLLYLLISKRQYLLSFLVGIFTFLIFQVFTRIPLIQIVLPNMSWYFILQNKYVILYCLFLGLTAGLFEEVGRYIMMKLFMKKRHRFIDAVVFGLGHGGIEAVLLVGINALLLLVQNQSIAGNSLSLYLSGTERISAMILHVTWSIMVMKSIRTNKQIYLIMAFIGHALLDSAVALLSMSGFDMIMLELILLIIAVFSLIYIMRYALHWEVQNEETH
ncbi:MAG: YhfC family glutamic-type intramembrane protease [Erysipelotrichaceae bacterium]|nr:YhfC family glutamic-type intramembrane protease [Erysipelotrichaceae bacterium]